MSLNIKKILFPTDFDMFGQRAAGNVLELARQFNCEVFVMHAIESPNAMMRMLGLKTEEDVRKKADKMMDDYIAELDSSVHDVHFEKIIKVGKPWKTIVDAANEVHADMIIFGTKGGSGLDDTILGSNANFVIRHANCPVITIRETPDHVGFKKILLPIDLSKETAEKVQWGIVFAKIFGSELDVLCIDESTDEKEQFKLRSRMEKTIGHIHNVGITNVRSETLNAKGNVSKQVIDYAEKHKNDLIAIMTHLSADEKSAHIMGTTADQIVNHSRIPIISIRPVKLYHHRDWDSAIFS